MPDSESEDEILERIEAALQKIAGIAQLPRPASGVVGGPEVNRAALAHALDMMIARLRAGLAPLSHAETPTE
ncbi:MAG: hypothetical protein POH28_11585 [Acidocella sp.]|nr:hypothetical protein [Acidocella sp.]